jgi:ATP-dependent exoDNAse (exonuclease V) beta subunit
MTATFYEKPILNSPYEEPAQHHALDEDGQPKAVVVMACDDDILPQQDRIETVADETELDKVYDTERHLFYVACTRARDRLLVTGVDPASEFFADMSVRIGTTA